MILFLFNFKTNLLPYPEFDRWQKRHSEGLIATGAFRMFAL